MNRVFSRLSRKTTESEDSSASVQASDRVRDVLIAAVWFGLVTGLVEGIGLWAFQHLGWLRGPFTYLGSAVEIVWIAPLVDLILFVILGFALSLVGWLVPRFPVARGSVFLFAWLMFFDWLAIPLVGRARIWAVLVLAFGLAVWLVRWFDKHPSRIERFWRKSIPWIAVLLLLGLGVQGGRWLQEKRAVAELPEAASGILTIQKDKT
jgi:hypothetical protein